MREKNPQIVFHSGQKLNCSFFIIIKKIQSDSNESHDAPDKIMPTLWQQMFCNTIKLIVVLAKWTSELEMKRHWKRRAKEQKFPFKWQRPERKQSHKTNEVMFLNWFPCIVNCICVSVYSSNSSFAIDYYCLTLCVCTTAVLYFFMPLPLFLLLFLVISLYLFALYFVRFSAIIVVVVIAAFLSKLLLSSSSSSSFSSSSSHKFIALRCYCPFCETWIPYRKERERTPFKSIFLAPNIAAIFLLYYFSGPSLYVYIYFDVRIVCVCARAPACSLAFITTLSLFLFLPIHFQKYFLFALSFQMEHYTNLSVHICIHKCIFIVFFCLFFLYLLNLLPLLCTLSLFFRLFISLSPLDFPS